MASAIEDAHERAALIRALAAERDALQETAADMTEALQKISQWAEAYPEDVFPPVDLAEARAKLGDDNLFSRLHASWARHLCKGIGGIARVALKGKDDE